MEAGSVFHLDLIKKLAGFVCRGPITRKLQPPLNRGSAWKVYTCHTAFVSCCQTGGRSKCGRGSARGHPLLFTNVSPRPKQKAKASGGTFLRDLELMNLLYNEHSKQKRGGG